MASPYAKPSQQLIWDLINRSNPQLLIPLSDDNCVIYGYPVSQTPNAANGMRNTRIRLYAKQGKGYKGELTVNYNRLSLNSLFTGINPSITNYTANNTTAVIAAINAAYGLSLLHDTRASNAGTPVWTIGMTVPDIIVNSGSYASGSAYTDNSRDFAAAPESLCWVSPNAIRIYRYLGNPDLSTLIAKTEMPSMRYLPVIAPGTYDLGLYTWGVDFTPYAADIANYLNNPTTRSYQQKLAQIIATETGLPVKWGNGEASPGYLDLYGFTYQNYSQAINIQYYYNTDDYNRALRLSFRTALSGLRGDAWAMDGFKYLNANGDELDRGSAAAKDYIDIWLHYNV